MEAIIIEHTHFSDGFQILKTIIRINKIKNILLRL
jgi:hypothetical protein